MAEGGSIQDSQGDSWESWLGGWMQTAKEKSQSALEFVKKDLAEFGTTIQKETEKAVEITKGSLNSDSTTEATKKVKAGLASFLDNVSKVLVIPHDDDEYVPMKVAADGSGLYDRGKARLHALQLDAGTYLDPPTGAPEQFNMWLESFSLDEHKGEISELLVSKAEVRALYTKLVPSEVSNADFWQRYFYRVHQLQCDEARKQALMMRADQAGKESVSWDDDDDEEDDDGNQSDWEKMPRPPQSYAAQNKSQDQQIASTKTEEIVGEDLSTAATSLEEPTNEEVEAVSQTLTQANNDVAVDDQLEVTVPPQESNPWNLHVPSDNVEEEVDRCEDKAHDSSVEETSVPSTDSIEQLESDHPHLPAEVPQPSEPLNIPVAGDEVKISPQEVKETPPAPLDNDSAQAISSETTLTPKADDSKFVPLTAAGDAERMEAVAEAKPDNGVSEKSVIKEKEQSNEKEIAMRVKGDMVVVGDRDSPSSTESADTKDLGLEDWEQFDVEITEEDLKAAEDIAKRLGENLDENDDDWENWE